MVDLSIMQPIYTNGLAALMNVVLLLLTYDVMCWCLVLYQHAKWLNTHPVREDIDCDRITHRMLASAAILAGIHMMIFNLSWIYFKVYYGYNMPIFLLIAGVNIMSIHLFALLARCTELDIRYWPHISKFMRRFIMSPCSFLVFHKKRKTD